MKKFICVLSIFLCLGFITYGFLKINYNFKGDSKVKVYYSLSPLELKVTSTKYTLNISKEAIDKAVCKVKNNMIDVILKNRQLIYAIKEKNLEVLGVIKYNLDQVLFNPYVK